MSQRNELVTIRNSPERGIPIAHMRNVFRPSDVERRLDKLPPKDHESLRSTYERMLEKGPERFQVKPSGLPAMDHLYDELPNFHEVLDDLKRQLALCHDSRDALEITPMLLLGPPGIGKTHFAREVAQLLGTGMGFVSMSSLTAGWVLVGRVEPVEGRAPGQGLRDPGRRPVRQPGDGRRRDRQGARRARLRPARRAVQPARARHRAAPSPTSSPRCAIDASQVIWVATANDERAIPEPILNRMNVYEVQTPDRDAARTIALRLYRGIRAAPRLGPPLRPEPARRRARPHERTGAARHAPRLDDGVRQRQARPRATRSRCATCPTRHGKRSAIGFVQIAGASDGGRAARYHRAHARLPRRPARRRDLLARAVRLRGGEPRLRGQRRPRLHAAAAAAAGRSRPARAWPSRWSTSCSPSTRGAPRVEVVILSRNDPVSGMRVFRSAQHYGLPIAARRVHARRVARGATCGRWRANLFLSTNEADVRSALGRRRAGGARLPAQRARLRRAPERGAHRLRRRRGAVLRRGRARLPARRARRLPEPRARPRRHAAGAGPVQAAARGAAAAAARPGARACASAPRSSPRAARRRTSARSAR